MSQPKFKIKKGDLVEVITGKDKGRRGTVSKVMPSESKIIVEGVKVVTRYLKQTAQNPDGPIQKTLPIHISNVALVDTTTDKRGKVKIEINSDGSKTRVFKASGAKL